MQVNGIEEVEQELNFAVVKASDKLLAIADHNLQLTRAFSPKICLLTFPLFPVTKEA